MVTTSIHNRSQIKRIIKNFFNAIDRGEYSEAKYHLDRLKSQWEQYCISRGNTMNGMEDLFGDVRYSILYTSNNMYKSQLILESFNNLLNKIRTPHDDVVEQFEELYDEIDYLLGQLSQETINEILECFIEIKNLKEGFARIGGTKYNYYTHFLKKMGSVTPVLRRFSQSKPNAGTWDALQNAISDLMEAGMSVIAPPVEIETTEDKVYEMLHDNKMSIDDAMTATGQTEEDLRIMLNKAQMRREAEEEFGE